jgi:isoamylase
MVMSLDALRTQAIPYSYEPGLSRPLGATVYPNGVNFAVFSRDAISLELLLFDEHDEVEPVQTIHLDRRFHRTFHFWHIFIVGLKPGMHYAYRVHGTEDLYSTGNRFNRNKVLLDPYALGNTNTLWDRVDACTPDDNINTSMRSVVIDISDYDWEGDKPLNHALHDSIIYEMHVGGFTRSATSGVQHPGTFSGVIEKIPYLQQLGITAVELLPIFQFDCKEVLGKVDGEPLVNYWGYSTFGFFSPHCGYCISPDSGTQIREFRDMVKALHRAGIEVILDVVFNHTNEGNHLGPTLSFKGFGNSVYYFLVPSDYQYYMDYSGCGNTLNCNHPVVEKLIVECLEFWVREMHVDGFRFDEASILARGEDGAPLDHPPVLWHIETSSVLENTKFFAEAWDAGGLNHVGYFPGYRYAEWNGLYRDDLRRYVRGDAGLTNLIASRIAGSADMYEESGRLPTNTLNFITCHDGFTLNDLVSYNYKHNIANGEEGRDGNNENYSWNCGFEGETDNFDVEQMRERQIKNFGALLLLSQGVPMILAGDEVRRSQQGNNNAYCHDSPLTWFDWKLPERHPEMLRFFQMMIALRKKHQSLRRARYFSGVTNERGLADITWHGCKLNAPGWDNRDSRALAFTLAGFEGEADLHVMLNMFWEDLEFELPSLNGRGWYRQVDTAEPTPADIVEDNQATAVIEPVFTVKGRSLVVMTSK